MLPLSAGTHGQVLHIRLLCFGIKHSSENLLNIFIKSKEGGGQEGGGGGQEDCWGGGRE